MSFKGRATDLKCPPGSYTITASLEGYVTQTHTFQVGVGEHHAERLQLAVDPAFVASLMADAEAKFAAGNFTGAVESARKLLTLTPGEAKAEGILAEASFQTGDFQSFMDAGIITIQAGGEITVPLMHIHYKAVSVANPYSMLHDVYLTLDRSSLTFKPVSAEKGCALEGFTRPYSELSGVDYRQDNSFKTILELRFVTHKTVGGFVIGQHDEAGKQLQSLDFVASGSKLGPKYYSPLQSPENAVKADLALSSVSVLIKAAAGRLEPAQANHQGISGAAGTTPSVPVACSDYDSCLSTGNQRLFHDEDRSSAIPYFQHALDFRKDATGWIYLGTAYLRAGRPTDVFTAWDEFLKIKKQIGMPVCHSNGLSECESGMLILGPKNVTWQVSGRTVFDIPATEVKVIGNQDHQSEGYISFGLEVDGTKYDFEFLTVGVPLNNGSKHVFTDAQGMAQQWTVGDYMLQTIKKLAAGEY